ncbi:putative bifunctional diguanylate cyclase/phosphodiesterase [Chromobacterium alticapitis]|uniref:GGDEF-domain containing protein n=1 Tax=Chromobacterium alticapitis TaxID=2073169 RepID=A0A2S5DB63_9NEIS|nr:EAL domain-containing protein [Chromobacterium alticapitis]POZ60232.1 hypothetical protein C2I19_19945 [Chromobacterium alticapitis]
MAPPLRPFRLIPYFFLLSLLLMGCATALMAGYLRHYSSEQLLKLEKNRAASLVQIFENSLWADFRPLISLSKQPTRLKQAASNPELRTAVVSLMRNSDVIRVKMYAPDGITVFSTDARQIGADENDDDGFRQAVTGTPASELAHNHSIDAFEHTLTERDIISTYVPVRGPTGRVEGVLELYLDATPFVMDAAHQLWWLTLAIVGLMGILFIAQMLVVRHAGRVIAQQAASLAEANRELDRRVADRTRELETSNQRLHSEIAERRRAEATLDRLAHHDTLTGLPNRLQFQQRLAGALGRGEVGEHGLAMLFIDLDRFKDVNDTQGHHVGDQLLIAVASRLASHVASSDLLARLGGDEFVCLMEGLASQSSADAAAGSLLSLFERPFDIAGQDIHLSASIGIGFARQDGADADTLLRNADLAMYQAKAAGRNRYQRYTPQLSAAIEERVKVERHLRQAIATCEIDVHYQPKIRCADGVLHGAEALARWRSPILGDIGPARFIPIAEESGQIEALGDLVLDKCCRQLAQWRSAGFIPPVASVNLSVKQLERADFPERVMALLQKHRLPPEWLELEITESVIMTADDAIAALSVLRQLGIRLSIDDFGTGYSSLSYLQELPVQTLKIDRAFVLGIGCGRNGEAIVRSIQSLADNLGLETVAEGVETIEQESFLKTVGCTAIQGFLYAKPLPAAEFEDRWLQATAINRR